MAASSYFRDRNALITGASSGIGRDVALGLSRMGARVALLARRTAHLDQLKREIEAGGGEALVLGADVTRPNEVRASVDCMLEAFGAIDILVNSAGVLIQGSVETMKPADLQRMMEVNLHGTLHAIQAVTPSMRARARGNIVNIASLAGRRGVPPLGGYCATKFAVVGLTEALRVELYGSGITVSLIMPGVVDTPMIREGESGQGELAPGLLAMPPQWVTWAVVAAIAMGLLEVDVPSGAALAEKVAALFPGFTDAAMAWGMEMLKWFSPKPG
ncbi:MAG TPA: SDR family oxidoreductase [Candidatus Binataceae bacterium]|nr:SDR family oxidoreductase [Candidatus Binataceae bacterium]